MIALLEKLINEHGSSAILRERLELFSDKYETLEEKLEIANLKISALTEENKKLTSEVELAKKTIEASEIKAAAPAALDETKKKILELIFESSHGLSLGEIGAHIGSNSNGTTYQIDVLIERKLLSRPGIGVNAPPNYFLSKEGRAFVVENMNLTKPAT